MSRLEGVSRSVTHLLCFLPPLKVEKIQRQKWLLRRPRLSPRRAAKEISTSSTSMASASLLSPRRELRRKSRITGLSSNPGSHLRMMRLASVTTLKRSRRQRGQYPAAISTLISSEEYMISQVGLKITMRNLSIDTSSIRGWAFLFLAPSTPTMLFPPRTGRRP
jgi:hypothetical protein